MLDEIFFLKEEQKEEQNYLNRSFVVSLFKYMFKKENILTKDKDFDKVFKKGRSNYDNLIGVKILVNDLNVNRVGIVIGKKVSKKAVERNRLKRMIRESIKNELKKIKTYNDILIICLPSLGGSKSKGVELSIIKHFEKLNLYK